MTTPAAVELIPATRQRVWRVPAVLNFTLGGLGAGFYAAATAAAGFGSSPAVALAAWLGPALVVVSLGAEGALGLWPGGSVRVVGLRVQVADTVGAGDAFTAGLLAALREEDLLRRDRLERISAAEVELALAYASRVAAITCTRTGADPPSRLEVAAPLATLD